MHFLSVEVLTTAPPAFTASEAERIADEHFGVTATARSMPSERDQNFHLSRQEGTGFVLKLSNRAEAPIVTDFQTQALLHIAEQAPELAVPRVCRTLSGATELTLDVEAGHHTVRLLTYLDGVPVQTLNATPALPRKLGECGGRLARALRGFFHSGAGYQLLWDIKHTHHLRRLLIHIDNLDHRALLARFLDSFDTYVFPRLPGLRAQVIYNDLTPSNVLTDPENPESITGVIDFGDIVHSPLVIDVAVAAAYQVLDRADPLDTAAELVAGYHAVTPLEAEEFDLLFDLIAARLVTTVVISSWRTTLFPENRDYLQKSMPAALRMLERLADVSRESAGRTFRQACRADGSRPTATAAISSEATETAAAQRRTTPQLIAQRKRLLGPAYRLFYDRPLHLVRGEGVWLYDADGRAYLDVYNNVPHVGHCHPRVVEAIARQAGTLNTHTRYLHETVLDYTERLTAEFPDNLSVCMFCCTGSEANELALRIARAWTGGEGVIVSTHAYHGNTNTMIQLSTSHAHEQRDGDRVKAVSPPDTYRGQYRRGESRVAERYAAQVQEAIEQLQHGGTRLAALFLDTVFTSDGILAAPHGYLAAAVDYVHAAGGLFVADEVQPGFGRLGETMWGFEAHHVVPDIVTLGKPIGNGHPLAAVVTTPEIMAAFARHGRYFNTFGGNPVSCAAGLAVLDVLENEQLQENAAAVGAHLKNGLQQLQSQHELIGDVRGSGFVSGVELVRDSTTLEPATTEAAVVVNGMRDRGVLIGSTGADGNVLKIRPPMVFSAAHADRVVATLDETLCSL